MNAHMILKAALLVGFSLLVLTMMSPIETSHATCPSDSLAAPDCPPDIDISKQEKGPDTREFDWGADVPYEITVTNTGIVDLSNVVVTDPLVPDCDRQIGPLPVGGPPAIYTCEALNVTQSFTNTAAVQGEANGMTVYDQDPSSVTVKPCNPQIDISKQEEGQDFRNFWEGDDIPYTITITNTGNVDLSGVVVTDSLVADCNRQIGPLPVGGPPAIYTCEAPNVTQSFTNIAAVQGDGNCKIVEDEDPSEVMVEPCNPQIDIRKQEKGLDIRTFVVLPGGSVDVPFTIIVTNTGNVDLSNVVVTDSLWANCNRQIGTLAVGSPPFSYTCEALDVTETFTNTASVQGVSNCKIVEDSDPSNVIVVPPPIREYFDVTVGFEDVKVGSDLDYNDWVVEIDTNVVFDESDRLKEIKFTMTPKARGAWLGHEFHIRFDGNTFMSDGVAELIIQDASGNTVRRDPPKSFDASVGKDLIINFDETREHNCTCEAFADHKTEGHHIRNTDEDEAEFNTSARRTAVLTITFDTPFVFEPTSYGQYCQDLFFDPYLHVKYGKGEKDHYNISWTDNETENLILCVRKLKWPPELETPNWWDWPEEQKRIDWVYTRVRWDSETTSFVFPQGWEACHNTCVFDGVKCEFKECVNSIIEVNSILYLPLMTRP